MLAPAQAADPVPGSACSPDGIFTRTGGPESGGAGALMVCNGSVWKSFLSYDTTANSTIPYALNLSGDIAATITANTDNWAPTGLSTASVIRITTSATSNLTGITGGADGRILTLINIGTSTLTLKNSMTSTAANQFLLTADLPLAANETATLMYDATASRWKLLAKGAASVTVSLDDLTDAFTDYATNHNLIAGRTGAAALASGAQFNTFWGEAAGAATPNSTSATDDNTAVGYSALTALTTGNGNVALGSLALAANTTGISNIAIGASALKKNTIGGANDYDGNIAIGAYALFSNLDEGSNIAIGAHTLETSTASQGVTAVGAGTMQPLTGGDFNAAFGRNAGNALTTGCCNTFLGSSSGATQTSGAYNLSVGYNVGLPSLTGSNQMTIGNLIYGTGIDGQTNTISSGNIGIGKIAPSAKLDINGYLTWNGQSRVTSTFSKTSNATLTAVTGLSATLVTGKTYVFELELYTTSGTAGGIQVDLSGGTATATSIVGNAISYDTAAVKTQTRISALNTASCSVLAVTAAYCHITGTITVNAGGTFIPRFAQNTSNATASTVAIGSIMVVNQIN